MMKNTSAPREIPYFGSLTDFDYYITAYGTDLLNITSISDDGKVQYEVLKEAGKTFLNVVFLIKSH